MRDLFSSLELNHEITALHELTRNRSGFACHADADGFCAGVFALQLTNSQSPTFYVSTEDLTLNSLIDWVARQQIANLATFDINVLSAAGALQRLAGALEGQLHVYDDHLGAASEVPANVKMIELLPTTDDGLPTIRPASFFCYALLRHSPEPVTPILDLLLVAAAHGEGVVHSLKAFLPTMSAAQAGTLARQIGRGLNAYFTDLELDGQDATLRQHLSELMTEVSDRPIDELITPVKRSDFFQLLRRADSEVTTMVDAHTRSVLSEPAWTQVGEIPIYLIEVEAPRRIVNLVASAARTKLDRGITIALQETPSGMGLELRRARDLNSPDLSAALLALPSAAFISRGGHPMAAGATIRTGAKQEVLSDLVLELRRQLVG